MGEETHRQRLRREFDRAWAQTLHWQVRDATVRPFIALTGDHFPEYAP